jgi:hypothetical protein
MFSTKCSEEKCKNDSSAKNLNCRYSVRSKFVASVYRMQNEWYLTSTFERRNNYFVVCEHILELNSELSFHISKQKTIKDWKGAVKYSRFWNGESVSMSVSRGKLGSESVRSLFGSVLDVRMAYTQD